MFTSGSPITQGSCQKLTILPSPNFLLNYGIVKTSSSQCYPNIWMKYLICYPACSSTYQPVSVSELIVIQHINQRQVRTTAWCILKRKLFAMWPPLQIRCHLQILKLRYRHHYYPQNDTLQICGAGLIQALRPNKVLNRFIGDPFPFQTPH